MRAVVLPPIYADQRSGFIVLSCAFEAKKKPFKKGNLKKHFLYYLKTTKISFLFLPASLCTVPVCQ